MKTGMPGTDTNGEGVAGGLNENAGIVAALLSLRVCSVPIEAGVDREAGGCSARIR